MAVPREAIITRRGERKQGSELGQQLGAFLGVTVVT